MGLDPLSPDAADLSSQMWDIQAALEQTSAHIESLQSVLKGSDGNAGNAGNASSGNEGGADVLRHISPQQRAHYHAVIMSLLEQFQHASKTFQLVQRVQADDEQFRRE